MRPAVLARPNEPWLRIDGREGDGETVSHPHPALFRCQLLSSQCHDFCTGDIAVQQLCSLGQNAAASYLPYRYSKNRAI